MTKVVILGAKGMLGRDLACIFRDARPLLLDKEDVDITRKRDLEATLRRIRPEIVINAAAYTDVDAAESQPELAMKVNGEAVSHLAHAASRLGACLVHYSTDYVFSGRKRTGYAEGDMPRKAVDVYGASKLEGERGILREAKESGLRYFLIRTSWLFGPLWKRRKRERNFVDAIVNLADTRGEIKVVRDQFGRPTLTWDLALATRTTLTNFSPGIYHVTNSTKEGGITWYEFAKKIIELSGAPTRVVPCANREFPRPATRPRYSVLHNTKLKSLRSWDEALREYLLVKRDPRQYFAKRKKEDIVMDALG